MSSVTDVIAAIDAKVAAIVADPDGIADYKIGDKTVSRSQILGMLLRARKEYQALAEAEPYEDIRHVAYDIGDLGEDLSEYIGDELE